jgi:cytochrome b subunit of formate dehydrogenase
MGAKTSDASFYQIAYYQLSPCGANDHLRYNSIFFSLLFFLSFVLFSPRFWHQSIDQSINRHWFNVDTAEVRNRLIGAVTPKKQWSDIVIDNPDLYGPFWIATTLVFLMGVTGNAVSWLAFAPSSANPTWIYDFTKVC